MTTPLDVDSLRWRVPADALPFEHTGELRPSSDIVGQDAALQAIAQGVAMGSPGYNIFVVGLDSGGRLRTVQRIVEDQAPRRRVRRDFVFVRNLTDPTRPKLLIFPAGEGARFCRALGALADLLFQEVPRILEGETVRKRRDQLVRGVERAQREALLEIQDEFRADGFVIGERSDDEEGEPIILFLVEDEPHTRADVHLLAHKGGLDRPVEEIEAMFDVMEDKLAEAMAKARTDVLATSREVEDVEQEAVDLGTRPFFDEAISRFPAARRWLTELHEQISEHVEIFQMGSVRLNVPFDRTQEDGQLLSAFHAQVLHRGSRSRKAPVVVVPNPTFGNLFGGVANDGRQGRPADHTDLRAGALHDADGGFLIINAADLMMEPGAWKTLKRAMLFGELAVQNLEGAIQGAAAPMRPDPIPLDVKVVLLGEHDLYGFLHASDPDVASIFKVKVEFDEVAEFKRDLPELIARFLARMSKREHFRPLTAQAVAAIIEWAVRQGGQGGRIRMAFGEMADLAREAEFLAVGKHIEREDVVAALQARRRRRGRAERHTRDALRRGAIRVETEGHRVGQVNGLAVYHAGGHQWGRPLRVTAVVASGRGGIVNIERESGLSGQIYDKGVHVLSGFIRGRFGRRRTLAITASIGVEQSYGPIDGDSASSAEVYAMVSALSGVGIHQGRAVTGSVDQLGNIQPIGGVNEKIEGFFKLCQERGLDGAQGVLIPSTNVDDLCLDDEVIEACAQGLFHIWPVQTVEEGLGLLMEPPVGEADAEEWPQETVYGRVMIELERLETVVRTGTRGQDPSQSTAST